MKIIYIHHGNRLKTNVIQDDLSVLGEEDCLFVSKLLNNPEIKASAKAIYSSTHLRCKKTADIINSHLNLPIIADSRLNEYKSFENETWENCLNRIINCIDDIIEKYSPNDTVICVTSGVNISAFICKAFNIIPTNNTPFIGVPSCSPMIFKY